MRISKAGFYASTKDTLKTRKGWGRGGKRKPLRWGRGENSSFTSCGLLCDKELRDRGGYGNWLSVLRLLAIVYYYYRGWAGL